MTIQTIAEATKTTVRTVQRWVVKFNEQHNTNHSRGKNEPIADHDLLQYINSQGGVLDMRQDYHETTDDSDDAGPMKIEHTPAVPTPDRPKKYDFTKKFAPVEVNRREHALKTGKEQPQKVTQTRTGDADATIVQKMISLLPVLPLPMLGLAASYGVYFFASQFVPTFVAVAEAAAFELIYIGLAALKNLSAERRQLARRVSIGAVVVSVIYNTLAGAIELRSDLLTNLHDVFFWSICIVHGAPLAVLAFYVSDLLFHSKEH